MPTRVATLLAEEIRNQILSGAIADGSFLPSERELSEQSGLGRSSVREALRILEAEGLITVRTGRSGGVTVRRPDAKILSRSIGVLVRSDRSGVNGLVEFRELLEPINARLAAQRRTPEDIAELEECNENMKTYIDEMIAGKPRRAQIIEVNARWHVAVATSTQNLFLAQMMSATETILRESIADEFNQKVYGDDSVWLTTLSIHRKITEAIARNDAEAAVRRMERHVHGYAGMVTEKYGEKR